MPRRWRDCPAERGCHGHIDLAALSAPIPRRISDLTRRSIGLRTRVIGIDFSTDPARTGLAKATVDGVSGTKLIHELCTATASRPPRLETVVGWVRQARSEMPVLIAIDVPLGWPDAMKGRSFSTHRAGQPLEGGADWLFSRETDRQIRERLGKRPLEVGANLIARSAHGALGFLRDLSREIHRQMDVPLPLAWSPRDLADGPCVVEVYPAATLEAHRFPPGNYKKRGDDGLPARKRILDCLAAQRWRIEPNADYIAKNDHMVDAALCVLAGWDFLDERAPAPNPDVRQRAEREGWIWASQRR